MASADGQPSLKDSNKNKIETFDVSTGNCQQKPMREIPNTKKADFSYSGLKKINGRDDPAY